MIGKIISFIIAIGYLFSAYSIGGGELLLRTFAFLLLPMACIWFGDELGTYKTRLFLDFPRSRRITSESPGCLVKLCGWFLLFLPFTIMIIIRYLL